MKTKALLAVGIIVVLALVGLAGCSATGAGATASGPGAPGSTRSPHLGRDGHAVAAVSFLRVRDSAE